MDPGAQRRACFVVPCFDEAQRLRIDEILRVATEGGCSLVLVDDGSTDGTGELLAATAARHAGVEAVVLRENVGKGEAVRRGLVVASGTGCPWVGYFDADLATPVDEVLRLLAIAEDHDDLDVVIGARVALLGRDIRRSPFRHYTGRVFATLASIVLHKPVYDTQCGAKVLRAGSALDAAVGAPFGSRWAFDVELLGRLARAGVEPAAFWEEPLRRWDDIAGSRRSVRASVRSTLDLLAIRRELAR